MIRQRKRSAEKKAFLKPEHLSLKVYVAGLKAGLHKVLVAGMALAILAIQCKNTWPALSYGYSSCAEASLRQAQFLAKGDIEKFRFMFLTKDEFRTAIFPRHTKYKGVTANDVWDAIAYEIERSNVKALEDFKGSTVSDVLPAKNIEEHNGLKVYRNFTIVFDKGKNAKGERILEKEDKILSALVEVNGLCRHWVNAYKD